MIDIHYYTLFWGVKKATLIKDVAINHGIEYYTHLWYYQWLHKHKWKQYDSW